MRIFITIFLLFYFTNIGFSNDDQTIYRQAINFVFNYDHLKSYLNDSIKDSSNINFAINDTLKSLIFDWDIRKIGIMNEILLKDSIAISRVLDINEYNSLARKILTKEEYRNAQMKEHNKWISYKTDFKSNMISISKEFKTNKDPDISIDFYPYINNILVVYAWAQRGHSPILGMNFIFYFDKENNIKVILVGKIES